MKFFRRNIRPCAIVSLLSLAIHALWPMVAYPVTGHDTMPEYTGFTPYSTSNMVNLTDGSFTYNLPLMEIPGGYPINLSYNSGSVNPESMASWVGLGWNLSPGSISLTKRGFPDTYNNVPVKYYSRMPRNWTLTAALGAGAELFGGEKLLGVNVEGRVAFNNYKGITTGVSGGLSGLGGFVSLNFDYSGGRYGFSPRIDPGALASELAQRTSGDDAKTSPTANDEVDEKVISTIHTHKTTNSKKSLRQAKSLESFLRSRNSSSKPQVGFSAGGVGFSSSTGYSFSMSQPSSYPTTLSSYTGAAFALKVELGINGLPIPIDPEGKVSGSLVFQDYQDSVTRNSYGYLHSEKALGDREAMMDYYSENEKAFEKRDKYLSIPFPNNDVYVVSGEGISGTFRAHRNEVGHYRKNYVESRNFSVNGGADINLASIISPPPFLANLVYTVGGNLGGDYTQLSIGSWDERLQGDAETYKFRPLDDFPNSDEQFYFRFSHDKSENKGLGLNNHPQSAQLERHGLVAHPKFSNLVQKVDDRNATGRSSYIGYTYMRDFGKMSNLHRYLPSQKKLYILNEQGQASEYNYNYYHQKNFDNCIGEFRITNPDGMQYVYGLPAFVRGEKNMNYSVKVRGDDQDVQIDTRNFKIAKVTGESMHANAKTITGYTCDEPYAGTHLLTGITSPDYVDRENDGLTKDDFGSYTRFNYQRVAGGSADWYVYRTPYDSVNFEYGSLSSNMDDMASYSAGAKEVYMLQSISSKTHVAIFRFSDREDGGSAKLQESSSMNAFLKGGDGTAVIKAKKLTRIDLYSLDDCHEKAGSIGIYEPYQSKLPIKSVCFAYDYSLCPGIPNNTKQPDVDGFPNQHGKLTLKKVWFEYGGTLTEKISPYQFIYEYPTMPYPPPYNAFQNYGAQVGQQNPNYKAAETDRWGNYRNFQQLKTHLGGLAPLYPYVDQQVGGAGFDPAAWQLKRIILPTGGEVHIQYEQGDYAFVQDRPAMVMVPLSAATDPHDETNNLYYLDLAKIGITPAPGQSLEALADSMFRPMRENKERLYFNYMYALIGDNPPDPGDGKSESIEGFARIAGYGIDSKGIYFVFKDGNYPAPFTKIEYGPKYSKREIPKKVCKDFYNNNRRGLLTGNNNALSQGTDESKIRALITLIQSLVDVTPCKMMAPTMSYVRLEAPRAKKGGPLRVKRLLMYDAGINPADNNPVLYGQEYHYLKEEHGRLISSGVAVNEPGTGRMENPLVQPIDKSEQGKLEAILYGRDMYGQTGPIGEYAMAGPGITYSTVVVSNIHQGKTTTGMEVHEFYTSRDYPFRFVDTGVEQFMNMPLGLSGGGGKFGASYSREAPFLAQGYVFIQNEMDGQKKRVRKYGAGGVSQPPIAEEVSEYFAPGEALKLMNDKMQIEPGHPGRETEILSDILQTKDITNGGNVEADLSAGTAVTMFGIPLPVIIPTLKKIGIYRNERILRQHVTTKIVSQPAILKRTINRADGVTQISEFEVFDKETGAPLITRTYDDFDGAYLSQEFRAYWNYPSLGKKSRNEGLLTSGGISYGATTAGREYIEFPGSGTCGEAGKFTEGDLILLGPNNCGSGSELLYHVDEVDLSHDRLYLFPSGMKAPTCTPPTNLSSVYIVRSGFKNQLSTNMGSLMTHSANGTPSYFVAQVGGQQAPPLHPFVADLNQALNSKITHGGNQSGTVRLNGPYYGLSIPTDPCVIDGGCGSDSLRLSHIKLRYTISGGNLSMELDSVLASVIPYAQQKWIACNQRRDTIPIFRPGGGGGPVQPSNPVPYAPINGSLGAVIPFPNSGGSWSPTIDTGGSWTPSNSVGTGWTPTTNSGNDWSPSTNFGSTTTVAPITWGNQAITPVVGNPNQAPLGSPAPMAYQQQVPPLIAAPNVAPNAVPMMSFNPFANLVPPVGGVGVPLPSPARITRDCVFPEPRIADERNMGNSNRKFYLTFIGDPKEELSHCGGNLPHRVRWHQRDRNNVDYWINVKHLGPGPQRSWDQVATGSGGEQDYDRTIYLPNNGTIFSENGLYQYDIYMRRAPIPGIESGALRWLTVYKCVTTCAPGNVVISGGVGETCLEQAGNHTFTANAATPADFGPFTYAWKVTGPEPDKYASSTNRTATFSFSTPGNYTVKLTVTDKYGKSTEKTSTLKVINCNVCHVGINGPAIKCLNYTPNGLTNVATPVTFTRNYLNNCSENTCTWQLSNASGQVLQSQAGPCNATTQSFTYSFSQPGNYFVKVRSTNNNASVTGYNEEVHRIEVRDCRPPRADFAIDMGPCPDRAVIVRGFPTSTARIDYYRWDFGDGTMAMGQSAQHSYTGCGPRTITLTVGWSDISYSVSHTFPGNSLRPCHGICDCKVAIPLGNWANFQPGQSFLSSVGKFEVDPLSGAIEFAWANCPRRYTLDCWRVCNPWGATNPHQYVNNVVSSAASTYAGSWSYDAARYPRENPVYQGNPFETGMRGRWLPKEQYVYRAPITQRIPGPSTSLPKNFSAGTYTLEMYDWRGGNNDANKWVRTSTTNAYTPNSEPEEDENILHVKSTAKYGYRNTLMTLAAQNAAKHTVAFEGFENLYPLGGQHWEEGVPFLAGSGTRLANQGFTGRAAVQLTQGRMFEVARIVGQGEAAMVRVWGKRSSRMPLHAGDFQVFGAGPAIDLRPLTQAGEWTLYEAMLPSIAVGNTVALQVRSQVTDLVIDDVRVQPYSSEMVCYVYDEAQRLLAAFDDQHFPLLYQYNAQGQLVRKLKVTVDGIKAISETQYNTQGVNRF